MDLKLLGDNGQPATTHSASDALFGREYNEALIHQIVTAYQANARQGTRAQKARGEVNKSHRKPWRQKGTGRARQGSIRAPHFAGGGVVFGPTPRKYTVKVNRKARRAALRCALSIHADRGSIFGIDATGFDAPSTKQAADLITDRRGGSVLVVLSGAEESAAFKSFRNIAGVNVLVADDAGVADIVGAATVVFSQDALDSVVSRARKTKEAVA